MADNAVKVDRQKQEAIFDTKAVSIDDYAKKIQTTVVELYMQEANGMAIRSGISEALMSIPVDIRKECTQVLRVKFDRLRIFGELASQEVMLVTSQNGW